jgi:hypothetical protein
LNILVTSFLISWFRGDSKLVDILPSREVAVSSVPYHEIMTGVKRKGSKGAHPTNPNLVG